jgi:opacity protein-like surface antigen
MGARARFRYHRDSRSTITRRKGTLTMKHTFTIAIGALAIALLLPPAGLAQTTHAFTFYGMGTQVTGTAGVGDLTGDIDISIDEFLEDLEMGGLATYRWETPRWSFVVGGSFFGLGQSTPIGEMDLDMTVAEFDAGYRFNEVVQVYAGIRYTDLSVELRGERLLGGEPFHAKNGDEFFDPVVGARFVLPLSEKWVVQGQGDIGGFGVGMEFQWQAMADLGYRPNDSWSFWLGYRALSQDFEDAGSNECFDMDATYQGPELGVTFSF